MKMHGGLTCLTALILVRDILYDVVEHFMIWENRYRIEYLHSLEIEDVDYCNSCRNGALLLLFLLPFLYYDTVTVPLWLV